MPVQTQKNVAKTMDDTIWANTRTTAHEALIELAEKYDPDVANKLQEMMEAQ